MSKSTITVGVREAKNRFSELVKMASHGTQVLITSHGEVRAQLCKPEAASQPFQVDWEWLEGMEVKAPTPSERIVRDDRDGRD